MCSTISSTNLRPSNLPNVTCLVIIRNVHLDKCTILCWKIAGERFIGTKLMVPLCLVYIVIVQHRMSGCPEITAFFICKVLNISRYLG